MRVLVTGGAGFIGSHIVDACLEAGHEVAVIDNLSHGSRKNLPREAALFIMDIRDRALMQVFEKHRPEAIFHQAAQVNVRDSVADPMKDAEINILGSLNLLQLAADFNVKKLVFASTGGAIYGDQESFPADESHPVRPLSPYGVAKLAVEKYLYFFANTRGLKSVALRYSNVYGPRQDPFGEGGVVAIFMERMLKNEKVVINGSGEQTRDFVYVSDVAGANMLALEKDAGGEINIATGREVSVNDIFRIIKEITRAGVEESHGPAKPGETFRSMLAVEKAEKELGWKPGVSLEQGLRLTAEFYKGLASD